MTIPIFLTNIIRKRKDIPFNLVFFMFATFIIGCGFTHFMGMVVAFYPMYKLELIIKIITAIISLCTASYLFKVMPLVLKWKNPFELAKKDQQYQDILDAAYSAVFLADKNFNITYVNKKVKEIFGWEIKEIIGKNVQILIPKRYINAHVKGIEEYLKTGKGKIINKNVEIFALKKDKTEFPVLITLTVFGDSFLAFIMDLTLEKSLKQSKEYFNQLVAGIQDYAILRLDEQGYIKSWNEGLKRICGYDKDEVINKHFSIFYNLDDRNNNWPNKELRLAKSKGKFEDEGIRVKKDETEFWANVLITAIYDEDGNFNGFLNITQDITERKEKEKIKLLNETLTKVNEELEKFAYIASHDLQDPLRTANAYIKLLEKKYTNNEAKEYVKVIVDANRRMQELVSSLLDYARKIAEPLNLKRIDCNKLLDMVQEDLSELISKTKTNIIIEKLPSVMAGEPQLKQVFQNLIQNAIKYTYGRMPEIKINSTSDGNSWLFTVQDNGCGISTEDIEKLFVLYRRIRKDEKGIGFGLATCKKIIEKHNGKIWVTSIVGEGSTFYIKLPK